jgi:AraC-like DNA-binding protein
VGDAGRAQRHSWDHASPFDRTLLESYWFSHLTMEALAADAGCSEATLRRRLRRAKARFARLARLDPALRGRFADPEAWPRKRRDSTGVRERS